MVLDADAIDSRATIADMSFWTRQKVISLLTAIVVTLCIAGVASVPHLEIVGVLFGPGILLGALIFPQGIEGDHGWAFLVTVGAATALLLWWPIFILLRRRSSNRS